MTWSLRRIVRALYRPRAAFADASPPVAVGIAVVVALGLLNAAGVLYAAGAVADATGGTVMVDNPAHPGEEFCEQAQSPDDIFYDQYHDECANEPKTVPHSLAIDARNAATDLAFYAFLAPIAAWFAVSGVFHLAVGGAAVDDPDDRIPFASVLAVTGLGFAPALVRYAVRPFAITRGLEPARPESVEAARAFAMTAMTPDSLFWTAVVAATAAWSGYVWWRGWSAAFDTSSQRAAAVALPAAGLFVVQAVAPVRVDVTLGGYGLLLLALGIPALAFPRTLERLDLAFDLVGTRGGENVEVKPWRVALEQFTGLLVVAAATVLLGGLALA